MAGQELLAGSASQPAFLKQPRSGGRKASYSPPAHHSWRCATSREPQPPQSSFHTASARQVCAAAGRAASGTNGAGLPQATLDTQPGLAELRKEISDLRQVVAAQGDLVQQQMDTISRLRDQLGEGQAASAPASPSTWNGGVNPFEAQRAAIGDRRFLGMYDARFHSTTWGATPKDFRVLPKRIILVRHAESEGNIDNFAYTYVPDPQVPLTERGLKQAEDAGKRIRDYVSSDSENFKLYFYISPYKRSQQTFEALASAFTRDQIQGCQEEVQLREQDFGNFQDVELKQREKAERLRFGRFFYRFPNGESGADVYDRLTIFEDHMIRDINAGRFARDASLVLVTHGLALRVFLMRWFHWSVDQFLDVYNPPNAEPLIMERVEGVDNAAHGSQQPWIHTKALYRLTEQSRDIIKGCTSDMCMTSCLPTGSTMWDDCREFPPWDSTRPS